MKDEYIELNMGNYTEAGVSQLNAWGIAAIAELERLDDELACTERLRGEQEKEVDIVSYERDYLQKEVARLELAIRRWSAPTGAHRDCTCRLCEELRAVLEPPPRSEKG